MAMGIYFFRNILAFELIPKSYASYTSYALILLSILLGLSAVVLFKQGKTTVNPVSIDRASTLVSQGVFKYTRNPMYLALLMMLVALTIRWQTGFGFVFCAVFILYMNRFQILPEERAMQTLFCDDYIHYKKTVRRWI